MDIEALFKKTMSDFNDFVDLLYIQATNKNISTINKELTDDILNEYLRKRGYTMNYFLGKRVMVNGFTCVHFDKGVVEIWHDKTNNAYSMFISTSILTTLPIALDYMEKV